MREHVLEEKELTVTDARQSGAEATRGAPRVLFLDRFLVALPIFSVGRIRDEVIEQALPVPIVRKRAAEENVLRVASIRALHEEVRLRDGEGRGIHFLTEEVNIGGLVDAFPVGRADDVILRDREHAARPAAWIVECDRNAALGDPLLVTRE